MNCQTCNSELLIQGSEGEYVRALCPCEKDAGKACKDCGDAAIQARLSESSLETVTAYYCREHGLSDYMEAAPVAAKLNLQGTQTGRISSRSENATATPKPSFIDAMRPQDDPQTNFWVRCHCNDLHLDRDRLWTETSKGTWTSKCPSCEEAGPVFFVDPPVLTETKRGRTKTNRARTT